MERSARQRSRSAASNAIAALTRGGRSLVELVGMMAYWMRSSKGTILRVFSWVASRTMGQAAPACWTCEPAGGADAPAVAGFEAGETVLRHRGEEIVAEGLGGCEEGRVDDAADGVDAVVVGAGVAAAVAVEAGHRARSRRCRGAGRGRCGRGIYGLCGGHRILSTQLSRSAVRAQLVSF